VRGGCGGVGFFEKGSSGGPDLVTGILASKQKVEASQGKLGGF